MTLRVPAAYDAYLRARKSNDRFDQTGFEEAVGYYREALRLDPDFAPAASALAMVQVQIGIWGYQPLSVAFGELRKAAERAIRLDPSLAEPHAALAFAYIINDWDWAAAEREIARAQALESHDLSTEFAAATLAEVRGNWGEAQRHLESALTLDPLRANLLYVRGEVMLAAGHAEDAEASVRRALQISPGYNWLRYLLARILVARGHPADALAVSQDEPDPEARLYGLALAHFASGHRSDADHALQTLVAQGSDWPFGIASIYAFRGEANDAFRWLDRAYQQHDVDLYSLKTRVEFAPLAKDPRYKAFLRKMNLPE
jgi:tetratricopeptide (TPR) repeat protein